MQGLALFIAWNQVTTSAVLLSMALVARPYQWWRSITEEACARSLRNAEAEVERGTAQPAPQRGVKMPARSR